MAWRGAAARLRATQLHGATYEPVGLDIEGPDDVLSAKGCDQPARRQGFIGRRGIYELLMIDDAVGPLILKSADAQTIKRAAIEQGMDTLRDDGARKVLAGSRPSKRSSRRRKKT